MFNFLYDGDVCHLAGNESPVDAAPDIDAAPAAVPVADAVAPVVDAAAPVAGAPALGNRPRDLGEADRIKKDQRFDRLVDTAAALVNVSMPSSNIAVSRNVFGFHTANSFGGSYR